MFHKNYIKKTIRMNVKGKLIDLIFSDKEVLGVILQKNNLEYSDKLFFKNEYFINKLVNDESLNDNFIKNITNLMITFSYLFHYFDRIISINKDSGQGIYLICSFDDEELHLKNFYLSQKFCIGWIKFPQIFRFKNTKYIKHINFTEEYSFKFTDCINETNETILIKFEKKNFIFYFFNEIPILLYYDPEFKSPYAFKFASMVHIYDLLEPGPERIRFLEANKNEQTMRKYTMDKLKNLESINLIGIGYILPQAPFMYEN